MRWFVYRAVKKKWVGKSRLFFLYLFILLHVEMKNRKQCLKKTNYSPLWIDRPYILDYNPILEQFFFWTVILGIGSYFLYFSWQWLPFNNPYDHCFPHSPRSVYFRLSSRTLSISVLLTLRALMANATAVCHVFSLWIAGAAPSSERGI